MTAWIDGIAIEDRGDATILEAASWAGVRIPTLCHADGLPVEGGCRICLVEDATTGDIHGACHTPLRAGMRIATSTPRVAALRRDVLSLMLHSHAQGRFRARADGTELERLMAELGVDRSAFESRPADGVPDVTHPYLRFDPGLCVACRRCVSACETRQGQFVYGLADRGHRTHLIIGPANRFADSACVSCGACVDACPTGALNDRDRGDGHWPIRTTQTVCGYCGVGCRIEVGSSADRIVRIDGVGTAAVNAGHLCAKGRYAHDYQHAPDRLTTPLLRRGRTWTPIPWDDAIEWLVDRLSAIANTHGPDALGALTSSRSTNEAAYLLQKLFRTAIGTNNIDCCARVCHASTAVGLALATGTGAASASYADIERAGCIVVAGANPTEAHPVVGARIKQAVLGGAVLIVIDPRRIELADYADLHLALRPGTNVALFNALARRLIEIGGVDHAYLHERVEGFEALRSFLARSDGSIADATGVDAAAIDRAADLMARHAPALFVHGLGLSEQSQGVASVMALCNLGMLTGSIGRPGAGMLPLRGQNNVQGNADMGATPDTLTGYQRVDDPSVRERVEPLWGRTLPATAGKTLPAMLDAAAAGTLRGLWVMGEDLVQSDPYRRRVVAALERLDLLVVQEIFPSETTPYAHLVLPAAAAVENDGTFTNGERRIQRVRPAVPAPGQARQDWRVVRDVARAAGLPWTCESPGDVMDEIAAVAPALFGGVTYDRLEHDGLQWPCPTTTHPGMATVHADGFVRGRGRLTCADYVPAPEQQDGGHPYLLITGRVLHQYNVGTMTRRTPQQSLSPADVLHIHPDDAGSLGIGDDGRVRVASHWGATEVPARLDARMAPGTVFLSFHHPATKTNALVGPHVDPRSDCPDYKVTAVRLEAV